MQGSIKTKFCNILVKKDFVFKIFKTSMCHDHTNDHNLDLTPFHTSLNNNALATIFQLSRSDFFHTNVNHHRKMRKMARNCSLILC